MKPLLSEGESLETNAQLAENVSFKLSDGFTPSHWEYKQLFNGKFRYLPSGENEARKRTQKLLESIPDICHEPHEHIRVKNFWPVKIFTDLTRKIGNLLCILP